MSFKSVSVAAIFVALAVWQGRVAAQESCICGLTSVPSCEGPPDQIVNAIDFTMCLKAAKGEYDPDGPLGECPNASAIRRACDVDCSGAADFCDVGRIYGYLFMGLDPCALTCGACCQAEPVFPSCLYTTEGFCTGHILENGSFLGVQTTCNPSPCDCQPNGVPDGQDIAAGTSFDINDNNEPDECEPGGCCFTIDAGTCAAGPNLGQPCATSANCQGSTCAEVTTAACTPLRQSDCEDPGRNGTFLGPGAWCPEQNVALVNEGDGTVFVHVIGPPVQCGTHQPAGVAAAAECTGPPYHDYWISSSSGTMCQNFGSPDTVPIPADFFGPGSDPFDGLLCLQGVPLGLPGAGDADTQIRRLADPFDRCALPSATPSTVEIEIVALSLASVSPITVTYNGGATSEQWDATIDLSPSGLLPGTPASSLTATKTHCNGGTYTSDLFVQPRFTFTKVGDPAEQRILDTGAEGRDPIELIQSANAPWVSDVDSDIAAQVDPCSAFHAGFSVTQAVTLCDCNGNTFWDRCDIETQESADCNANLRPDECDITDGTFADANGNGELDICEAAPIPVVSEWGLCVLAIVTLTAGTICLRRRRLGSPGPYGHLQ